MEKTKILKTQDFRMRLQQELVERCSKNPMYSLRAFAKSLGIAPSALSAILNKKRPLTKKMVQRLAVNLGLSSKEIETFQKLYINKKTDEMLMTDFQQLALDTFAIIGDWYHYAILELIRLKNFDSDPKWMAQRLGITKSEVNFAIERLHRVGLLKVIEKNGTRSYQSGNATNINGHLTSGASKRLQKQLLEKSMRALEELPIEVRNHTSITVAINSKSLEEAKEKIKNFRRHLCAFFEQDKNPNEVYQLQISLYPLTNNVEVSQ
jgi:uncharacterized protein (TIGR02147 family)